MKKVLMLLSVSVMSVSSFADPKIIYGDDNRVDVYASTNSAFVELAKSTAAMMTKKDLKKKWFKDQYNANTASLQNKMQVCSEERFSQQPSAATCSGFLVGPKHIVTAGHCMTSMKDCNKRLWVFGYSMQNESQAKVQFTKNDVYKCKKIISQQLNEYNNDDYALIELDREVVGRTPLKFRRSGKPSVGDEIVVIGHPSGLPTKIADGAKIRTLNGTSFQANLDTYGGNSGSAVFNVSTGEVEGILVRGARDYVVKNGRCRVSNRVTNESGNGEGVTYITRIKELMNL
jgi:V8-like Glu-specific endopeptidase